MEILQISALATLLLTEFFKSSVTEVGKKFVGGLFELIKKRFGGQKWAEKTLTELQNSPSDEEKQALLRKQIEQEMARDEKFASLISEQVNKIIQNRQTIFVNDIGKVNNLIQINTFNGDINL